ncbi:hypothetical protein L2E82_30345 [Cichorium intybus]|uniref:Uncharacterized protein n=1 Tax=Cichorium intybus TaxID=13427 RepID=A0ACB9D0M9_CICIN|nr:hypothetical protein L2E82_30345 [Cichorium intybus]
MNLVPWYLEQYSHFSLSTRRIMSKMTSSQGIACSVIMLLIICRVNGRWLEADTHSTSMISDGVPGSAYQKPPDLRMVVSNSLESTTTLYDEKRPRCHSIYGFLPCADTMQEGVFLMLMYTYLMMLGEE